MLRDTSVEVAISLAQSLDERNLVVITDAGTPLAEIVGTLNATQTVVTGVKGSPDSYTPNVSYIQGVSDSFGGESRGEPVAFEQRMDGFVKDISKAVSSHLAYARTVVKPIVLEVAEEFQKQIAGIQFDPYADIKIVQYSLPSPLVDAGLVEDIMAAKNSNTPKTVKSLFLQPTTIEEILSMLNTGSHIDAEIQNWAASKGTEFLLNVWDNAFTMKGKQSVEELLSGQTGFDAAFAVYILATRLKGNPPQGTPGPLSRYEADLMDIRAQAATRLAFMINMFATYEKNQLLIKSFTRNTIEVVAPVYKKFIDGGGNNGIVIAATMTERPYQYLPLIEENREKIQQRWERHLVMSRARMENQKFERYSELLEYTIKKVVAENFKDIYSSFVAEGATAQQYEALPQHQRFHALLAEAIPMLRNRDFEDLGGLMLKLVCQTVFYFTGSYEILYGINEAIRKNPDLAVSEAALLSTTEYVTRFVLDQLTLKSM